MQFGDLTFRQGADTDLMKVALLIERGDVLQIAGEAIQAFRQDNIDRAGAQGRQQGLVAPAAGLWSRRSPSR